MGAITAETLSAGSARDGPFVTYLVTGGGGFVGSNIVEDLLRGGHDVLVVDKAPPCERQAKDFASLPGALAWEALDIRDTSALEALLRTHRADAVIHAAAVTSSEARDRAAAPDVVSANIVGTASVIQSACRVGARRIVLVSSVAVFSAERFTDRAIIREDADRRASSLYATSKIAAEDVAVSIASLYGADLRIGRVGIAFGPWERDTGFRDTLSPIHQICAAARSRIPAQFTFDRYCNWHYVRDAARSLVRLVEAASPRHRDYNLGPASGWCMSEWCRLLEQRYPGFHWGIDADGEVDLYCYRDGGLLSGDRFSAEFGAVARYDLASAFAEYLEWLG